MWFWIRSVCQESKRAGFPENQIPVPCKRNCKQEPGSSCNSVCAAREKREKRQGDGNRNGMDGPGNFPASGEGGSGAEAEAVPGSRLWKPPPIFPRHPTPILSRQAIMIRRLQVVSARQLPLYLRREAVRAGFSEGITGASRFLRFCDIFS